MRPAVLTFLLLIGFSVSSGQSSSVLWLLEKAKEGDASAQNELGVAYAEGTGIHRDQRQAVYWFSKAAAQGNALGTCNLGLHYGKGWGLRRNLTLMMKYVFAANALDGLKCNPGEFTYSIRPKPTECQIEKGWTLAVAWLRAHPDFKNDLSERPWMDSGKYPTTVREHGPSVQLPIKRTKKCR